MMNVYWTVTHGRFLGVLTMLCLTLLLSLTGCGDGTTLAPVKGQVTIKGEPVKGGTLLFSPAGEAGKPGNPASATIQPDGSYTLTTNSTNDGAVVGRHRVGFTPPPQELTEEQRKDPKYHAPPPLYMGMAPKQPDVEVKSGNNTIDIELVPAPPPTKK